MKMRALGAAIFMPGGEQSALMELFYENNESMSGYFHAWVASKAYSWMFYSNSPSFIALTTAPTRESTSSFRRMEDT